MKGLLAMVLSAAVVSDVTAYYVSAAKLTNDVIKQSEQEKENAESSKAQLKKGLTDVKQLINSLEAAKGELENYIVQLDDQLSIIEENIEVLKEKLEYKQQEIDKTKLALEDAIWQSQQQYGLMKKRIQFIYEKGQTSNIEMILNSSSFVDFLNRAEYVNQLSAYDRKMLNKYVETMNNISDIKGVLEKEEEELTEAREDLESEQEALEELIAAKQTQIVAYQTDINNKEAAVRRRTAVSNNRFIGKAF